MKMILLIFGLLSDSLQYDNEFLSVGVIDCIIQNPIRY